MNSQNGVKVLFVCLGNICRSPTAHGVFQKMVDEEGLSKIVEVESAGTSGWHIGEAPDSRTAEVALTRGVDLSQLKGRKAIHEDFHYYDYILAMDNANLLDLISIAPKQHVANVGLFLEYASKYDEQEVPDPYYGGAEGFDHVFNLVEDASAGLLKHIKSRLRA